MKLSDLRNLSKDDLLEMLGLEERHTGTKVASGIGLFAAGIAVGAGLAMLFAPSSGEQARREVGERASDLGQRLSEKLEEQSRH
jgi:gas vesicle protein